MVTATDQVQDSSLGSRHARVTQQHRQQQLSKVNATLNSTDLFAGYRGAQKGLRGTYRNSLPSSKTEVTKNKATDSLRKCKQKSFIPKTARPKSQTKSRLPWLDGNRAYQTSNVSIPGAFLEDNIEVPLAPTVNHSSSLEAERSNYQCDQNPATSEIQTVEVDATRPLSSYETHKRSEDQPVRSHVHSKARATSPAASDTTSLQIRGANSRSAPSLLEMAKQLNETDSSIFTDSSSRVSPRHEPRSPSRISTPQAGILSPSPRRYIALPIPEPAVALSEKSSTQSLYAPRVISTRRVSLALQPLRKVTMSEDDAVPQQRHDSLKRRTERMRSFSVQPIRIKKDTLSDEKTKKSATQKRAGPTSVDVEGSAQIGKALRDSIAGLENLMQEAVRLAKVAAEHDDPQQIPLLLEGAKSALSRPLNPQSAGRDIDLRESSSEPSDLSSSSVSSEDSSSEELVLPPMHFEAPTVMEPAVIRPPHFQSHLPQRAELRTPTPVNHNRSLFSRQDTQEITPNVQITSTDTRTIDWAYANEGFSDRDGLSSLAPRYRMSSKPNNQLQRRVTFRGSEDSSIQRSDDFTVTAPRLQPGRVDVPSRTGGSNVRLLPHRNAPEGQEAPDHGSASLHDGLDEQDSSTQPVPEVVLLPRRATDNWGRDKYDERDFQEKDYIEMDVAGLKGKHHISLRDGQKFSLHKGHKRQPIARNWSTCRKRWTAIVACMNTSMVGMIIGIYAGEVPAIQYALADEKHRVILGNVALYCGLGISTLLFWPLPLLHGRKPYTLLGIAVALPLQFPQALVVSTQHNSNYSGYRVGLLLARALSGLVLGFAHINFMSTLLDLFGASLQSNQPHGEIVVTNDIRRHGGGMGLWLGIWAWTFIASIAIGFLIGAVVISGLNPSWGFYICVMILVVMLLVNVLTPETRRSPHRRTMQEVELPNESISRRVARGEIKMHVSGDGPKWWWEEVFAGAYLSFRMLVQSGFLIMTVYLAWIYAEIVLIIVLLGNLLSKDYQFRPQFVGLGVLSVAIGALLAVPNSKANIFSRSRKAGPRTDSMTFQPRISWTSHLVRRAIFMITLPIAGIAYTLASSGTSVSFMAPITFAGVIGYISNLAIAECNGIIMETFDTSDLQPGANSRHRLQSLAPETRRKRTMYSSYPRVSAGLFVSQALGFFFAAAATGVGGAVTRHVGAQKATAITAGILLALTILLTCILWRFKSMQVIPNELFGEYFGSKAADRKQSSASMNSTRSWRAVIIGNPSGKVRRMSWLELGSLSRWTEVRRLNRLLSRSTTQALNPGWR